MGFPISPVLADMFMEEFYQTAIATADFQPQVCLRYVDNIFVVWQHGQDKLQLFLDHLNGLHIRIQFTVNQERDGNVPFLDEEVSRQDIMAPSLSGSTESTPIPSPQHQMLGEQHACSACLQDL